MVKIRLKRKGRKKHPIYRIVTVEDSNQRDGKVVEYVGTYNPHVKESRVSVKEDRVKYWLGVGAQPSSTVNRLLSTFGLTEYVPTTSSSQKIARKDRKSSEDN